jgi:hypothetical protein
MVGAERELETTVRCAATTTTTTVSFTGISDRSERGSPPLPLPLLPVGTHARPTANDDDDIEIRQGFFHRIYHG